MSQIAETVIVAGQSGGWRGVLSPARLAADLWRNRDLIRQLTRRDVLTRYRGTAFGLGWAIAQPLLTLAVYTLMFSGIFKSQWADLGAPEHADFILYFFCGYLLFTVFAECANRAPTLVAQKPSLVTKVVFPLQVLPVVVVGSALILGTVQFGLLIVLELILTGRVPSTAPLFALVVPPLLMLSLGVGWFLASLGVFVRDVRQIVGVMVHLLFIVSAVFYPLSRLLDALPGSLHPLLYLNPMGLLIDNARRVLLTGVMPQWGALAAVWIASLAIMQLGYAWFMKTRGGFADVI